MSKKALDRSCAIATVASHWSAALLVGLICAAYYPALDGDFILDDDLLLTDNELIKASDGLLQFWYSPKAEEYYPISNSTLWVEWRLWGMRTMGYHVANLVLHVAAAILIWVILEKLAIGGAFLAALLFALHPVNVESVAWIAQRKDALAMVFFLLSILSYLQGDLQSPPPQFRFCRPGARRWYWLSLLAFLLAMLSKGSVAVLPAILLLIVWWQRRRIATGDIVRVAPYLLVAVVLTPVNIWYQTHGTGYVFRDATWAERLIGAGGVVWFYLSKALAPVNLVLVYPQWRIELGRHSGICRWRRRLLLRLYWH